MNGSVDDIREDIAFLKSLALDGGAATPRGGGILALAGIVYAGASVAQWAAERGMFALSGWGLPLIWLGATVVFLAGMFILLPRRGSSAKPASARAMGEVWRSVGLSIFVIAVAFLIAANTTNQWIIMGLMAPVVLALYGGAWSVGAQFAKIGWVKVMPWLCFAASAGTALLIGRSEQYLAYAAALVLVAVAPGLALANIKPASPA
ncbi:MAG: hypothetical protein WAU68_06370 [Vitreimonas sp.]